MGGAKATLGIGLSSVAGVPAGTLIGEAFGRRATFWALAGLSLVAGAMLTRCAVPDPVPAVAAPERGRGIPWPMLLVALVIVFGTGGVFALHTYASPYLTQSAGTVSSVRPG